MATRVTFVSGTAEVKRREKKDPVEEPMMVASEGHLTGNQGNPYYSLQREPYRRPVVEEPLISASSSCGIGGQGNPYYSRALDERDRGGIDSVTPAQPVTYVDGKCTCCPYGFHIDLDFLSVCQDQPEGGTLNNLKRIQRAKRKLRKSMEVMLHQQQYPAHEDTATATLASTPPPDVVHSTEASRLINMVQYEQSATHQVLRNIDTSVNARLATMEPGRGPSRPQRYTSSDSEDGYSYGPVSPVSPPAMPRASPYNTMPSPSYHMTAPPPPQRRHHHYHPSNGDESSHFATSLSTSGRTDSMSSLSSVSTVSSEQVMGQYTAHASGMLNAHPQETATAEMRVRREPPPRHVTSATAMTVEKLAATMATHFPQGDRPDGGESPSSPISPTTTIGKASLAAIREAMAVSLQRMRELEEQVKAIPILQVRISVLKEEKRLLALQLKARSTAVSTRSLGVGEESVYSPLSVATATFAYPTASSPFAPLAASPRSPGLTSWRVKTVGVGDHSVVEPYLLQPHLPTGYTITDNLVQTEIRSREIMERPLPSLTVSTDLHSPSYQDRLEARSPGHTHFTINQIQRSSPRPLTRSIGVGDANVLDSSLQIHEKELRTVIIGSNNGAVGKRNVGVEVRVPTRSVGVSFSCDDARPATRTVGVNVNYDTSNVMTTLDFKGESELRMALRGVLQRSVRSMGIQCSSQAEVRDTGVQHEAFNMVSVGCGGEDCRVDVDIRQPITQRSLGTMARPEMSNRVVCTDKDWVQEAGTNTVRVETYNKASSTDTKRLGTVATNTHFVDHRETHTQTEGQMFQNLQAIKTTGVNTIPAPTVTRACNTVDPVTKTRGVNTKAPELTFENFDVDISFDSKAINTPREFYDMGVNTNSRELQLAFTKTECVDVPGDVNTEQMSPSRSLTMQEHILQRGANQASAFIGSTSSSGSQSPTSSHPVMENESVNRTVRETLYTSPGTFRQVWTSDGLSQQSDVLRTGGEARMTVSGNLGGDNSGGGGYSRSMITRTITSSSSGGDMGGEGGRSEDLSSRDSAGSYRSIITRTISGDGGSGGFRVTGEDGSSSNIGGGVSKSIITKTISSSGGDDQRLASEGSSDSGYTRSVVTKTITRSGNVGDRPSLEDVSQGSRIVSTYTTGERNMGRGFSVSLGEEDGSQRSSGGGLGTAEQSSQGSYLTTTVIHRDQASGSDSNLGRKDRLQGGSVTKTISTSGSKDELDTMSSTGDTGLQQSTATSAMTRSLGGGHLGGGGGGREAKIQTKTITITRTGGGSVRSPRSTNSSSLHSYSEHQGLKSQGIPSGGTGYLERFGFAKTSGLSSASGSGQTQMVIVQDIGQSGNTSSMSMDTSSMSMDTGHSQTQSSQSASQKTEGDGFGAEVDVVEGRAVLQSAVSESSLQSGQVTLVGGSSMQQDSSQTFTSSSGSLPDMSVGVQDMSMGVQDMSMGVQDRSTGVQGLGSGSASQSVVTESVVRKRSSGGGGQLTQHRHSYGGRLSKELAAGMQGAFSGRRVGSVEDFMPDDMRRLMNIEVTGSKGKSRSGGGVKSDRLLTKTVKTVTTKRTTQGGQSTVSVTKTITNPDGSVTTISNTEESGQQPAALGHLSSAQQDLSKIVSGESPSPADSQTAVETSESHGMKDSGCYDGSTLSSVESESHSLEGVDMTSMGSLERKQLKSIMKRSKADSASSKKGISFADSVVGGTGSSTEEEGSESDDESTTSYDEGSYDGREGDITYQCRDDEAIAQGLPGAKMYDQNIRETSLEALRHSQARYDMSEEMLQACQVLADYLVDSTTIQTKQLNANLAVVQEEWFRVSSHKLSSAHQVEDYLSSINEISHRLLDYIVNLVDNNGNAAIHYCVSHCNFDIVGLLLDTEVCDMRRPNKAGYTPAMLASLAHVQNDDHRHIILQLFAASEINAHAEQTGQTALMLATSQCRTDMVQLLLEAGADCNVQDFDGSTALMCACEHGHAAIVQLLLAQPGCDASMADNESSTALSIAMEAGHKDVGVILYKHLNFSKTASPGSARKRKGTSSPTPRNPPR